MEQRFRHCLKHVLEAADPGKNHGGIENHSEETPQRNILQNLRQGHKQQPGASSHVKPVSKAGWDNDQRRNHCSNGIKQCGMLSDAYHILVLGEIRAVDNHAAAGDGK